MVPIAGGVFGSRASALACTNVLSTVQARPASASPNPNIRLDRDAAAAHPHQGEQRGADARHPAHVRVQPMRMLQALDLRRSGVAAAVLV
jgi:hypothetical protein